MRTVTRAATIGHTPAGWNTPPVVEYSPCGGGPGNADRVGGRGSRGLVCLQGALWARRRAVTRVCPSWENIGPTFRAWANARNGLLA